MAARRSYGTGRVYVRADRNGRETFYGSWYANGRRVNRSLGPRRETDARDGLTTTQAETRLRELIAREDVAGPVRGDVLTISDLGARYTKDLQRQARKKATLTALESILRVWLIPFFGERDLRRITTQDVTELIGMMESGKRSATRQAGDRRYGRPVGPKSVRNYIGTLSALLGFAERKGWLATNVARRVDLPGKPEHVEIRFLEPVEVQALADAATTGPYKAIDRALYIAAAMTGLREGELIALRWRDVDWAASRVRVRQNYVLGEFGTPKSKRSPRSVPWPIRSRSNSRDYRPVAMTDSCSLIRSRMGHSTRRRSFAGCGRPSRRRSSPSRTRSTICATRSEREWLRPAYRCGRCRSGWATATSRQRSGTRTTRRVCTRRPR